MNIGILQTAYKKLEDYGAFYNVQELGLARALASKGHVVTLYKAVDGVGKEYTEIDGRLRIKLIGVRYLGINGLISTDVLDTKLEVIIYFCDTQLKVPTVYKWCKSHNVIFIPYIGVVESHSENRLKRLIMDYVVKRNISVFRKSICLAKTPAMVEKLHSIGCDRVELFPAGLDEEIMHQGVDGCIKDTVLRFLFIGRMEEEKQPFEMIRVYEELLKINPSIHLTMIGDGYMYDEAQKRLSIIVGKYNLSEGQAQIIRKVPYNEMYSYYDNADLYINLNKVEILGMSILEAMYYSCPVLAITAPGPEFILKIEGINKNTEEEYCGMIAPDMDSLLEVLKMIALGQISNGELKRITALAKDRVEKGFVWKSSSDKLISIIDKEKLKDN